MIPQKEPKIGSYFWVDFLINGPWWDWWCGGIVTEILKEP